MKPTSRNLEQHCNTKRKTLLNLSFSFCLQSLPTVCLAFCLLVSVSSGEIATEQLDPTDLLMSHSSKTSNDSNTTHVENDPPATKPFVQPAMNVVELPSDRKEHPPTNPPFLKIAPVNFALNVEEESPQDDFIIAPDPKTLLTRQLWKQRITFAEDENDQRSKNELRRIIEQIRSVEFDPPKETLESALLNELISAAEPDDKAPDDKSKSDTQTTSGGFSDAEKDMQTAGPLPHRTITDHTLQLLEDVTQHPEQLTNPFELAEVLFLSGHLKQALACYQEALRRRQPQDARSVNDSAWILFQIANCLRGIDRPLAMKTYRQLIAEYPDSPWTELAKAQDKLVDWFNKDKPLSLITQTGYGPGQVKSNMEYAAGE
ncbi:MAG: tetratricopeptide repeat protein [Planctomycetota bacterium]|nr:MAG: tetratricopeptide repeat protein [Planctomycetota bacterium]